MDVKISYWSRMIWQINLCHPFFNQESQFRTVPVDTVDIYCTGKQTGTYESLVSYRKKYQLYRSPTGRTGKIRLFQPVNGYQTNIFSHATLNFCLSLPPLYHTGDDEIPIGSEERCRWYWFMHWKSVLSEEKNYNGLMLKELDRCESCDTEREREIDL